ncbi:MAG TPA: alpha/beta fold hydrolase [Anaeromyxobacteraceae bacterium]|nr:alpha/beta fold hydrolase [Anaeromyxobacteraceae bacterium]
MVPTGLALGVAALALALATWAHFFYWGRRLKLRPDVDQILYARTADGWRIALARRRPRGPARRPPVLLCHGLAANRHVMDFAAPGHSLALALAARGFDCFSIDLRGHGLSAPTREAPRAWTLDDYLRADLPAALDLIREETGSAEVLLVGHSQGALLGLAAAALTPERIAGVVAIAPPGQFGTTPAVRQLVRLGNLGLGFLLRPLARLWAPFGPIWHPRLAELALRRANVEPEIYRLFLANGAETVNPGVVAHFAQLVEEDRFRSFDRKVDYGAAFAQAKRPALFISGEKDGLAPPRAVEESCVRWGGPKRYWSAGPAYGHGDLLIGRRAAAEVHPVIAAWLEERSTLARPGPAPR